MPTKKQWFQIFAPKIFDNKAIGEVLAIDAKNLINKRIEVSLSDFTQDLSRFYVKLIFKIRKSDDKKIIADFDGHECLREYISHIVRAGITRVDNNIVVTTKDNYKIRVKGILLFSRNVNKSIADKARALMNKVVMDFADKNNFDDFVKFMIFSEMANRMKDECKKLYSVSKVEIRKSEVLESPDSPSKII
ncbi:MAG: hypothetical protein QXQ40_01980 [Candidatus Aenigmatarchaeota archaeon]